MSTKDTRDFAEVGVHQGSIFLEANEWDATAGRHFVVTLYLPPEEAIQLAEQIHFFAIGTLGSER